MLKKILLTIISLSLPMLLLADEIKLNQDAPKSYIVKKGDTLWDISGVFLKQPWLWPKLWRLNPEINNPHLIYPGDKLQLVYDEQGQPMLVKGKRELKWSPSVRTQLKDQSPVSTLPLNVIAPFIKYNSVMTTEQLDNLPYVLGSDEGYKSSQDGFKVYVTDNLIAGRGYAIYEKGDAIIDPETQEQLGYHVILVGTGKAIRTGDMANKKPGTIYIEGAKREIRSGNYVMPVNEGQLFPSYFTMQAVNKSIRGVIINASSDNREFGKLEVVMINRGKEQSVKPGDVLSVSRKSPGVIETGGAPIYSKDASRWNKLANENNSDYDMPEEPLGNMMVFKVYDKVSMALILNSQKPLRLDDVVTAPL
ncbi:LysM peptidoglycan-binding domain-containing protein [Colwelliaceae bacterium 6471]